MDLKEKASYILGLMEGAKLDYSKEENNIVKNIAELLHNVALKVEEIKNICDENSALLDEIDEDLSNVEKDVYGCKNFSCKDDNNDFDQDAHNCRCGVAKKDSNDEDFVGDGNYEVACPSCKRVIELDDEIFEKDEIVCPDCGEKINFDFKEDGES